MMMSNIIDWSDREARLQYHREYNKIQDPEVRAAASRRWRRKDPEKWRKANNKRQKRYHLKHPDAQRIFKLQFLYNFTKSDFIKMWEKQNGHCANPHCNIKLVDPMFFEEKREYENDLNLTKGVDYSQCNVDHDHDYALKHGKCKEMVRGLLCSSCNRNDVLNPDSKQYIHKPKVDNFTE
jgi:hypothetical protein